MEDSLFHKNFELKNIAKLKIDFKSNGELSHLEDGVERLYAQGTLASELISKGSVGFKELYLYYLESKFCGNLSFNESRLLCRCFGVSEELTLEKLKAGQSPMAISEETLAGSNCGKCFKDLCLKAYEVGNLSSFDGQETLLKNLSPIELMDHLGSKYPALEVVSLYENIIYVKKECLTFKEIEKEIYEDKGERVFFVKVN